MRGFFILRLTTKIIKVNTKVLVQILREYLCVLCGGLGLSPLYSAQRLQGFDDLL